MKWMLFVFIFVFSFGLVSATVSEVVLIDDIGSFSGAVLRVKSPISGDVGDKIYAKEDLTSVGILKFEIASTLEEVLLSFVVTKGGMVVEEFEEGPFVLNGSEILVDRREGALEEVSSEDRPSPTEASLEMKVSVSNDTPSSEEVSLVANVAEEVIVEEVENDLKGDSSGIFLTGRAVFVNEDGSLRFAPFAGGGIFILMFGVFVFMMFRSGSKNKEVILSEDDKELAYMEKRVRETEGKISKIRKERENMKKLEEVRGRLDKEKKQLRELEGPEKEESEKIEDLD